MSDENIDDIPAAPPPSLSASLETDLFTVDRVDQPVIPVTQIPDSTTLFFQTHGRHGLGIIEYRPDGPLLPAVQLDRVCKKFRERGRTSYVLNRLTMRKCFTHQIYVLYGAIKSGKSTVLRVILNTCRVDMGSVYVFGRSTTDNQYNRQIGYMPELYGFENALTVNEMTMFYATMNGMKREHMTEKFSMLKDFMAMTDLTVSVGSLQEHQKRVLCFFIACLRDPELLLLDEPTSGCDPVYKHFIWRQIRKMVSTNKVTVLLTASDESECMWGDVMGYLRNGKLIAEDAPTVLMRSYNVRTISQMLFCVSIAENLSPEVTKLLVPDWISSSGISIHSGGFTYSLEDGIVMSQKTDDDIMINQQTRWYPFSRNRLRSSPHQRSFCKRLWTYTSLQIRAIFRNVSQLLLHFFLPILCVLIYFYAAKGNLDNAHIGIVGNLARYMQQCPRDATSSDLIEMFDIQKYDLMQCVLACSMANLSYVEELVLIFFATDKDVYMYLNNNNRIDAVLSFKTSDNKSENDVGPKLELAFQQSAVMMTGQRLTQIFYGGVNHFWEALSKLLDEPYDVNLNQPQIQSFKQESTMITIKLHESYLNSEGARMLWGGLATILHFWGALSGAMPLHFRRTSGIAEHLSRLGVSNYEQQLAHFLVRFVVMVLQCLSLFVSSFVLLLSNEFLEGIITPVPVFALMIVIMVNQMVCGFALGVLLYGIFNNLGPLILTLAVIQMLAMMFSGFFWTELQVPLLFRKITEFIPHKPVAFALFGLLLGHAVDDSDPPILQGMFVPLAWTALSYLVYFIGFTNNNVMH